MAGCTGVRTVSVVQDVLVQACGAAGSVIAFVMFVPQALRCWRMRHNPAALEGVSRAGMVMLLINAVLWGVYGLGVGAIWSAVPSFFNAPLAVFVLVVLRQAGRRVDD